MNKVKTYEENVLEIQAKKEKMKNSWIGSLVYSHYYNKTINEFNKLSKEAILNKSYEVQLDYYDYSIISSLLSKNLSRVANSGTEDAAKEIGKVFSMSGKSFGKYYFNLRENK